MTVHIFSCRGVHPRPGGAALWRQRRRGVADPRQPHQADLRRRVEERHRRDEAPRPRLRRSGADAAAEAATAPPAATAPHPANPLKCEYISVLPDVTICLPPPTQRNPRKGRDQILKCSVAEP